MNNSLWPSLTRSVCFSLAIALCYSTLLAAHGIDEKDPWDIPIEGFSVTDAPASDVVSILRNAHQIPLNFIASRSEVPVTIFVSDGSVGDVLEQLVLQDTTYVYESLGAALVLRSRSHAYNSSVHDVRIISEPRVKAVYAYVKMINFQVPDLADLMPPVMAGDPSASIFGDPVTLSPSASVLEHLIQLCGVGQNVVFSVRFLPSGRIGLVFELITDRSRLTGVTHRNALSGCDVCAPTAIDVTEIPISCSDLMPGAVGAALAFKFDSVTSACGCKGGIVTETVTVESGGCSGIAVGGSPQITGLDFPIDANNDIQDGPAGNHTDSIAVCGAFTGIGECTDIWVQKLSICGRLVQTIRLTLTITGAADGITGVVKREITETEEPAAFVSELGDQSFAVGETKSVECKFLNRTDAQVSPAWAIAGHGSTFTPMPVSGSVTVGGCMTSNEPLSVACNEAGNKIPALATVAPPSSDTGSWACTDPAECGDGTIDPGEECGEPGLSCPANEVCNDYCICQPEPLAVSLNVFEARVVNVGVALNWSTESEIDNEGFNVLRSTDLVGWGVVINSNLIHAEGGPAFGVVYEFVDDTSMPHTTYFYLLEHIDTSGIRTLHGANACTFEVDPDCKPLEVHTPPVLQN